MTIEHFDFSACACGGYMWNFSSSLCIALHIYRMFSSSRHYVCIFALFLHVVFSPLSIFCSSVLLPGWRIQHRLVGSLGFSPPPAAHFQGEVRDELQFSRQLFVLVAHHDPLPNVFVMISSKLAVLREFIKSVNKCLCSFPCSLTKLLPWSCPKVKELKMFLASLHNT